MANADRPNGLRPVGTRDGAPWASKVRIYEADASRTTTNEAGSIGIGDPVKLEADGKVTVAAAGDAFFGVCVGVIPFEDQSEGFGYGTAPHGAINLQRLYLPANVAGNVLVTVGDDVIYEIQEDGEVSQLALTDIGANVDLVAPTTHLNTTTGVSLYELNSDTVNTTSQQMRIWNVVTAPDNEVGSTGCRWEVYINENQFNSTTGI